MAPNRHNALGRLTLDGEVSHDENAAVLGRKIQLETNGAPPNLIPQSTQLISVRTRQAQQWVITLMQPTKPNGPNPWVSTFDGDAVYPPVAPHIFTAPVLPTLVTAGPSIGTMQVALRWGAGGVYFETVFDYIAAGGAFGVTADLLEVNIRMKAASAVFASLDLVPVVGAFVVPGESIEQSPLRWLEQAVGIAAGGAENFWAVKPYARQVQVSSPDALTGLKAEWKDTAGNTLRTEPIAAGVAPHPGADVVLNVPAQATVLGIVNMDAGVIANVTLEWRIGLT